MVLACYNAYHVVYLNGKEVEVQLRRYEHPRTGQFGLTGYVDVSGASKGINSLTVSKEFGNEGDIKWDIPFYYMP